MVLMSYYVIEEYLEGIKGSKPVTSGQIHIALPPPQDKILNTSLVIN